MRVVSAIIIMLTFWSCSSKYEKFDKYFTENNRDTIHIYCIDTYDLPNSIKRVNDTTFRGKEIDIDLVRHFKFDSIYDKLLQSPSANYYEGKKFFAVFKYNIANNYIGYVVRVSHVKANPQESIVEYVYDTKENKFDTTIFLAYLWCALSADNDINSWIFDINKDGNKDLLAKSSFFDYGLMDDVYRNNKKLDNKSIIASCRHDTAWSNLWKENRFLSKPILYNEIAPCFNYKMLEYYNGYRRCYWFE
jgi:hypothetical protein